MLDSSTFSTVIYIWYEGGGHKPPLVRLTFRPHPSAPGTLKCGAEGADRRSDGGSRVSVPVGRHGSETGRARQKNPDEGGDKSQWRRKPRAGRRRQRRSVKLTSPARKKGGGRRPLFNVPRVFQIPPVPSALLAQFVEFNQFVEPSQTRTRLITSHCSILSTTSIPEMTRPKTV